MYSKNQSYNRQCLIDIHTLVSCHTIQQTMQRCVSCNGVHCFRASGSLYVSLISRVLPVLPMSLLLNGLVLLTSKCLLAKVHNKICGQPKQPNKSMDIVHTPASYQPPSTRTTSPMSTSLKMRSVDGTLQYRSLLLFT